MSDDTTRVEERDEHEPDEAGTPASDAPANADGAPPERKERPFWLEIPVLILLAFGLALFLKQFVVQAFYIPSESMVPTLQVEDRLLVDKLVYRIREPRRGEIVVFIAEEGEKESFLGKVRSVLLEGFGWQKPGDVDFVKRIIGLPGETVELVQGVVYVTTPDGERFALEEPYVEFGDQDDFGPTRVPEGHYFVLGDNRGASSDSRTRGPIARSDIIGRARLRIWPWDRIGRFPTPDYDTEAEPLGTPSPAG